MGNKVSNKRTKQWYSNQKKKYLEQYEDSDKVEVVLLGDNIAGKTSLVKCISNKAVQDYVINQRYSQQFEDW